MIGSLRMYSGRQWAPRYWPKVAIVAPPTISYADQILADGATLFMRFDEPVGATTTVSEVGPWTGAVTGGVTLGVPGPLADLATAAQFVGASSGRINIAAGSYGNFGLSNWTYEVWLRYVQQPGLHMNPVASIYAAGVWGHGVSFLVMPPGLNQFAWDLVSASGGYTAVVNNATAANGAWHLFTAVLNRSALRLYTYLDGVEVQQENTFAGSMVITNPLTLGWRDVASPDNPYTGDMANLAIYPLALTPAQVANHYALRTAPPIAPGGGGLDAQIRFALEHGAHIFTTPSLGGGFSL